VDWDEDFEGARKPRRRQTEGPKPGRWHLPRSIHTPITLHKYHVDLGMRGRVIARWGDGQTGGRPWDHG
jgi:hypothetical protein